MTGYISLTWLLGQQVHGAEIVDIGNITDIANIADIANGRCHGNVRRCYGTNVRG